MKDKNLQMFEKIGFGVNGIKNNVYYNYACFNFDTSNQKLINVTSAVFAQNGYGIYGVDIKLANLIC